MPIVSLFLFALLGLVPTMRAFPLGMYARQALADTPKPPACLVACATNVTQPMVDSCLQVLTLCFSRNCMLTDYEVGTPFISPYCTGNGMTHTENGVVVTDVPPVPSGVVLTTTPVPLSAGPATPIPSTVIVTEFVTLSDTPPATIATTTSTSTSTPTEISTEISPTAPSTLSTDNSTPTFASATASTSASTVIIESTTSSTTLRSPAAISVYVIISVIIILLMLVVVRCWRRTRQRDYIIPSHRRTRGKSFLIDEASLKRHTFHSNVDLTKPAPTYKLSLKEEASFPALPVPIKDSADPFAAVALSYIPQLAVTHTPTRNYTALPGRSPSPGTSPEPEKSFVNQTFAAGRERAITNIRHSREGSRSPTSPSSSISSPTSPIGDMYASATQGPLPAHAYMAPHQPNAPSPLRAQIRTKPVPTRVSTIQEEPRTPHGAQTAFSMSTTMPALTSKVETAQRRPTFASHVRGPGSTEKMQQFTFPNRRQSLNETELQITISEALLDNGVPASRSQTPNGSMYRGAGGSVSSIFKVQEKLQALVGGIRRER